MDLGVCEKHGRPFEALCKDCEEYFNNIYYL